MMRTMTGFLHCTAHSGFHDSIDRWARSMLRSFPFQGRPDRARLVIEVTPPSDALIRERTARLKTIARLFAGTLWFTARQIHDLQPRPPKNPSAPASDWKRRGKIYAVSWDEKAYFPAHQFSEALQPLPVIADVLAQFGEVADT